MNFYEQKDHDVLTVRPAFGRDYKSKDAALEDWNSDKDFIIMTPGVKGTYINKADAECYDVSEVNIRYNKLRRKVIVKVKEDSDVT